MVQRKKAVQRRFTGLVGMPPEPEPKPTSGEAPPQLSTEPAVTGVTVARCPRCHRESLVVTKYANGSEERVCKLPCTYRVLAEPGESVPIAGAGAPTKTGVAMTPAQRQAKSRLERKLLAAKSKAEIDRLIKQWDVNVFGPPPETILEKVKKTSHDFVGLLPGESTGGTSGSDVELIQGMIDIVEGREIEESETGGIGGRDVRVTGNFGKGMGQGSAKFERDDDEEESKSGQESDYTFQSRVRFPKTWGLTEEEREGYAQSLAGLLFKKVEKQESDDEDASDVYVCAICGFETDKVGRLQHFYSVEHIDGEEVWKSAHEEIVAGWLRDHRPWHKGRRCRKAEHKRLANLTRYLDDKALYCHRCWKTVHYLADPKNNFVTEKSEQPQAA